VSDNFRFQALPAEALAKAGFRFQVPDLDWKMATKSQYSENSGYLF